MQAFLCLRIPEFLKIFLSENRNRGSLLRQIRAGVRIGVPVKKIIACSDGTGNTAIKDRGTNVFKLFEAIDVTGHETNPSVIPQVAFYDDGVGTENFKPLKILGGACGWGLSRNVKHLYKQIVRVYDPGD